MLSKKRKMWLFTVLLIPALALFLGAAAPQVWAKGLVCVDEEGEEEGLDECEVFFEFQKTDCDVGPQIFADGGPWLGLTVREEKSKRAILKVITRGTLRRGDGGAEFNLEGGEPQLSEDPCRLDDDFVQAALQQYRAGGYTFTARSAEERCLLKCDTELTYEFPPAYKLNVDAFETESKICWDLDPDGGGGDAITVSQEIVVEFAFDVPVNGEETEELEIKETATFLGDGGGEPRCYTVSEEFLESIDSAPDEWELVEAKAELLSQEASGNRIIVEEDLFEIED